ncbi:hypothetical protein [Spirosoma montaniterrae]|uniref:Glycoside hydrolase family 5 domain-containing protein n=1 Tax=Spirosoma montaniterrae TaxID=1178516 RepID=A0A1P9WRH6_9BACT|nr:hypothetical protein [Spirosoma montaniterrae]AQG77976.1 hypothetical protein AWR27_00585 [Spirosoma montaniterrae]
MTHFLLRLAFTLSLFRSFTLSLCAQPYGDLTIQGTNFYRDGRPFPFTGVSFFNAIYNPTFNKSSADRKQWLAKFQKYGINVLRIWCQWDNKSKFVDSDLTTTLYRPDGSLQPQHLATLKAILTDADQMGMVVELALFSQESYYSNIRLDSLAANRAVSTVTRELLPHRNLTIQIWNELSERVIDHYKTVKAIDPSRLVTNSPGISGILGDRKQNETLDYLSPHTSRQYSGRHWEVAPTEITYLLKRYKKPVVDDEPARNGTPAHGGPKNGSDPHDHILQIGAVWQAGGYVIYHHDMFQTGYGSSAVPPSGIPDPEFNPYHRTVFSFLALRDRYMPAVK